MKTSYAVLKPEYDSWVANAVITRHDAVEQAVKRVETSLDFYRQLASTVNVPAVVLGAIDYREGDCNPALGIGQGDHWNQVSRNVPRGKGPFASRLAADVYYIRYDGLDRPPVAYDLSVACCEQESYNGLGYRAHGRRTPYVVGGTNLQQPGKYIADGKWDGGETDVQVGTLPIMMRLIQLHPDLAFGAAVLGIPTSADPPVISLPADHVAGTLAGTEWLQDALNRLKAVPPDVAPLQVDGNYGRRTRAAVRAFQTAAGIHIDGQAGPETCEAIDAALAKL